MGLNTELFIKKAITETLVEELFRELGFFVLKFGKENTVNPLIQLQSFIKSCDGKFKLQKEDDEFIYPVTYINKMPDFVIVDKTGKLEFLEVKFRRNAKLTEKDEMVFEVFPEAYLLVINLNVDENFVEEYENDELKKELVNTRFHIWQIEVDKEESDTAVLPLKHWLKNEFNIDQNKVISQYETLITKWLK